MKFITIDGIDKSGKSTIIAEVFKKTNGKVFIIDRSMSSWHFFNVLLDRIDENSSYKKEYNNKLKEFRRIVDLSIFLKVNEEDWIKRCKKENEPPLVGTLSMYDHQLQLEKYFMKARYKNILNLNTSHLTINECVNAILKRL